jgi:hypothetical protein
LEEAAGLRTRPLDPAIRVVTRNSLLRDSEHPPLALEIIIMLLLVTPTLPLVAVRNRMVDLVGRSRHHPVIRLEADLDQDQALVAIHHHRPHSLVSRQQRQRHQQHQRQE